jgi:proteasome lid subunit RPN8/RPN11
VGSGEDNARAIRLPRAVFEAMRAHVQAGYPNEACGVLAGVGGQVVKHYAATNASDTPETFSEIGSRELLAIWQEVDAHDWDFFAYYHSHPQTPAYPSPRDILLSQGWPGTFSLIFSLRDRHHPELRAFLIAADRSIVEFPITVEDGGLY